MREHDAAIDAGGLDLETGGALPFDDEAFDLVAILFYLHRPLFAEARRVVKRGGIVVSAAKMRGTYRIAPGSWCSTSRGSKCCHSGEGEIAEIVARKPRTGI